MAWRIEYADSAVKQLKKFDRQIARQIINYLDNDIAPMADPRTLGKALSGALGNFWRYRVGDYRIICHIENEAVTVLVLRVSHRSTVYEEQKKIAGKASKEIKKFREQQKKKDEK